MRVSLAVINTVGILSVVFLFQLSIICHVGLHARNPPIELFAHRKFPDVSLLCRFLKATKTSLSEWNTVFIATLSMTCGVSAMIPALLPQFLLLFFQILLKLFLTTSAAQLSHSSLVHQKAVKLKYYKLNSSSVTKLPKKMNILTYLNLA